MLDFTASLYLGMRHGSEELRGWDRLTTGVPPALGMPAGAVRVAGRLAALQGCERAVLFPSTLHAFWDLCDTLCGERASVFVDAGTYAVAARGVERARLRGATVERFAHHSVPALVLRLAALRRHAVPIVVADGFCPACGRPAPLASYLEQARRHGGWLVVDDTQALGVFGTPAPNTPYGSAGGGSLRRLGVTGDDVLVVASLAKAFCVPLAAVSGARAAVAPFERSSPTRVHSSGVSAAVVSAADHAFDENDSRGDALRRRLYENVRRLRSGIERLTTPASQGYFPVQFLHEMPTAAAARLTAALGRDGIRALAVRGGCGGNSSLARVAFALRATIDGRAIDAAIEAISRALGAAAMERPA